MYHNYQVATDANRLKRNPESHQNVIRNRPNKPPYPKISKYKTLLCHTRHESLSFKINAVLLEP